MTGSRRAFLIGAGGAAAGIAALGGTAATTAAAGASEPGRVPLLVTSVARGRGADGEALARLRPGGAVHLVLAPTDYDGRAVAVRSGETCVGYVPRRRAEALAGLLAAGYAADGVVREIRTGGARPEVMVEVRLIA